MSSLPALVIRLPSLLYGAAMLFFVASFGLSLVEINNALGYAESGNPMLTQMVLRGFYQAALDGVYLAAYGGFAHILLAIWKNGRPEPAAGEGQ